MTGPTRISGRASVIAVVTKRSKEAAKRRASTDGDGARPTGGTAGWWALGTLGDSGRSAAPLPLLPLHPHKLTAFHSFGLAFCVTYYTYIMLGSITDGYAYGGWSVMVYTWAAACVGTMCVACALGELASASPVNGGLYYYAARLAPQRWRGLASYLTAWLSLLGTLSSVAGTTLVLVQYAATLAYLATMDAYGESMYVLSPGQLTALYSGVILLSALLNSLNLSVTSFVISFGIYWNFVAFISYTVTVACVAPYHQPVSFIFAQPASLPAFVNYTGFTSQSVLALLALSFPANTLYGFESAIFMIEETDSASAVVPFSLVLGVASSCLLSWAMILTTGWCVQSVDSLVDPNAATGGYNVPLQVLWDSYQARFGNGGGGLPLTLLLGVPGIVCVIVWSAGVSRKLHAMSRDGLVPGSAWLSHWPGEGETGTPPRHAVWATHGVQLACGALVPFQAQALFFQVLSFSVLASYLSYLIPIALRLAAPPWREPRPGVFDLGWARPWVHRVAVAYILCVAAALVCPWEWPLTLAGFNYAGPATLAVLAVLLTVFYVPRRLGGVRHWWHGPVGGRIAGVAYAMWD